MKVTGFREMFQINRTIKAHAEGGDGHGSPGYENSQKKSSDRQPDEKQDSEPAGVLSAEQELEAVEKAIVDFQAEAQSQQHGLQAAISGSAPGLRVVLSDVNGNVIRQFEAREFVRLRSAGTRDTRGRGKLLDQKY